MIYSFPLDMATDLGTQEIEVDEIPPEWLIPLREAEEEHLLGLSQEFSPFGLHMRLKEFNKVASRLPYRGFSSYAEFESQEPEMQLAATHVFHRLMSKGRYKLSELMDARMVDCSAHAVLIKHALRTGEDWHIYRCRHKNGRKSIHTELLREHPYGHLAIDSTSFKHLDAVEKDRYIITPEKMKGRFVFEH